jgi:hypothetical protein
MGFEFYRNGLDVERLERFQAHLRKNIPGRRIRWNIAMGHCGAKCLAGHMRDYVAMREGAELGFHNEPATFFGIAAPVWYNLAMAKGYSYVVKTNVLDLTEAERRKELCSRVVEKLILTGDVPWYVVVKEVYGTSHVDQIVKWNYDKMG